MNSALYTGTVRHRRFAPREHRFRYRVFQPYLDLAELPEVFRGRWLWSTRRPAPAWFRRSDYLGDPQVPLAQAVADLVEERTGRRPSGPIRLLTHLRYFGFVINPVSFYFCFDPAGEHVEAIVAEITNTPWNERFAYVLDAADNLGDPQHQRFRFRKTFHVSPFLSMDYLYDWRFVFEGDRLVVHMENHREGRCEFDATMTLERRPLSGRSLAVALARHPWMTGKVFAAIYWQALRLWWKRCPFFPHPRNRPGSPAAASNPSGT